MTLAHGVKNVLKTGAARIYRRCAEKRYSVLLRIVFKGSEAAGVAWGRGDVCEVSRAGCFFGKAGWVRSFGCKGFPPTPQKLCIYVSDTNTALMICQSYSFNSEEKVEGLYGRILPK